MTTIAPDHPTFGTDEEWRRYVGTLKWEARNDARYGVREGLRAAFPDLKIPLLSWEGPSEDPEGRDWHGYLTVDNAQAVADRLNALLGDGRRYTFVAAGKPYTDGAEVRRDEWLDKPISCKVDKGRASERVMAHLIACDQYGVWGISTTFAQQQEARKAAQAGERLYDTVHVAFGGWGMGRRGQVTIKQFNGYGEEITWVIAAEETYSEADDLYLPMAKVGDVVIDARGDVIECADRDDRGFRWETTGSLNVLRDADLAKPLVLIARGGKRVGTAPSWRHT